MAHFISCGEVGHNSEKAMFKYLQNHLPSDWVILGSVPLIQPDRDLDVDAVIIGRGKIWLVEAKCWHGDITGDQFHWLQNEKSRTSPLRSLANKARVFASAIKKCGISCKVTSLVIMLADKKKYSLTIDNDPSVAECVHHLSDVEAVLNRQTQRSNPLTSEQMALLIKRLAGQNAEKTYNDYVANEARGKVAAPVSVTHASPTTQTPEQETVFMLSLQGQGDFTRSYFSCDIKRILLGKTELRGAFPPLWENWTEEGLVVRFASQGVGFEAGRRTRVVLNDHELPEGKPVRPNGNKGRVNIGGIELNYEIATIVFD
jgi:hypothetical protein